MKKLILIITFLFPLASYAKWTKVTDATDGSSYYIDFESIKENNSYLYYWMLRDFLKPVGGFLSGKQLMEVDCKTPRKERTVSMSGYLMSMGEGVAGFTDNKLSEWTYSSPGQVSEVKINLVCSITSNN
ncbi:hypothetical protein N9K20_02905 [Methylophilaceae bacterium]|nr:hypothetical protein [Methylophilaceae bacterium]